ncbi:site-specific integrase [Gynuella sunshinyii]|uniref:Integrase SAM-like N-terminal domain-containing protein n=1 Tax=Gynuella sunshinyii YC6258 TaxID=1445510 RepID=A0A0C5VFB3_9GAMM|nr:site-specific integrase [Gynuella sunshinyii]AJQ92098.1 hypothetical Protein YC6258_00042 [Gynuella sunshinyii YC6258]
MKNIEVLKPIQPDSRNFRDQFRLFVRNRGLVYAIEKTYCLWVKRFIRFHKYQSPEQLRIDDAAAFLTHLANDRFCSPNWLAGDKFSYVH